MAKICVLEHAELETPGILSDVLALRGIGLNHVRPFRGEPVPRRLAGHDGLLLMGGPMGVYETDRHPWLRDEVALIESALEEQKPILGICLGSQLLAAALGARVSKGRMEIGWLPVTLAPPAATDPLWDGVARSFTAFHWHGDVFDLPLGAAPLAASAMTPHQAFRHGANAYGILFHMEVTEDMVRGMVRAFPEDLRAAGAEGDGIVAQAAAALPEMHRVARTVFDRWSRLLALEPA